MYESALPDESRRRLAELGSAALVVGIPSYRNPDTVAEVVHCVATALDRHYAALSPVIVHVDGHSFDDTLSRAARVPLPPTVRRVATRYHGLPGRGSAVRALCEIATTLQASALLLVEADVRSLQEEWVPALVAPLLAGQAELTLARYRAVEPRMALSDLLLFPMLRALFGIAARYPAPGEVALSGRAARFVAARDVWETDAARAGIDLWLATELALHGFALAEVPLSEKVHRSQEALGQLEAKFLQEVGTLFRLGTLHERRWQARLAALAGTAAAPLPLESAPPPPRPIKAAMLRQMEALLAPPHVRAVAQLLTDEGDGPFPERLWARLIYDAFVVYNLGEGDPDKAVSVLLPLFQRRRNVLSSALPDGAYERLIEQQAVAFEQELPYLVTRWQHYLALPYQALHPERDSAAR